MSWNRVTNISFYVKSEDYVPDEDSHAISRRLYSFDKGKYPLILIEIYANLEHFVRNEALTGIGVSISKKSASGEWWEKASLPLELIPELQDMLTKISTS